jgi:phosphatidylserine/phosphatidylglycerophosphate/cardiolipin synthase-like enzyme
MAKHKHKSAPSGSGSGTGSAPNTKGQIDITFLQDVDHGGAASQPASIASLITGFCKQAQHTLHIAIYDFRLSADLGSEFIQTLIDRANAGVDVKIAYDHTKPNANNPVPFNKLGGDPAPKGTHIAMHKHFAGTKVQTKPVLTIPDSVADKPVTTEPIAGSHLMHSKYIIRDTHTPQGSVWTGSANFTDDAWTHQENNILRIQSPDLAQFYETDFQELWSTGNIKSTGVNDQGTVDIGGTGIDIAFAPGGGPGIDAHIASLISSARKRVKIASMVITSAQVLGAIKDALENVPGLEFDGIYDGSEMGTTMQAWKKSGSPQAALFTAIAKRLVKKDSTLFTKKSVHNFMHDKIVVCDDQVATGSFNFSKSATMNAENSLVLQDSALADQYAQYVDKIVAAYS